jgi:Domain of unknown function (DUF4157)
MPQMAPPSNLVVLQRKIQSGPVQPMPEGLSGQTIPAPLPEGLKAGIEGLSGMSMADVRVHYNSEKPYEVQAKAFTQGTTIHVAPGQEENVPHEAWHVVQQKQGRVRPSMQMGDKGINDDAKLENEADEMGPKAARGERSGVNAESVKSENAAQSGESSAAPATSAIQRMRLAPGEGRYRQVSKWVREADGKWVFKPTWVREGTQGMDPTLVPLHSEYATDHIHNVSRVPPSKQGVFNDGRRIERHLSTRYLTEAHERQPHKRRINASGRLVNEDRSAYSTVGNRPDVWILPDLEPPLGSATYVMAPDQSIMTADPHEMSPDIVKLFRGYGNWGFEHERTSEEEFHGLPRNLSIWHHSSFLAGGDVIGAGEISTNAEGQIQRLTNGSGHYRPNTAALLNVMDRLEAGGANLDTARIRDFREENAGYTAVEYSAARGNLTFLNANAARRQDMAAQIKMFGQPGAPAIRRKVGAYEIAKQIHKAIDNFDGTYRTEENMRLLIMPLAHAIIDGVALPFNVQNRAEAGEFFAQCMEFSPEADVERWRALFQPNAPLAFLAPYYRPA